MGLNIRPRAPVRGSPHGSVHYGAIEAPLGEAAGGPAASRSSRRAFGSSASGQNARQRLRRAPSRQCRKAIGPRHCSEAPSVATPSIVAVPDRPFQTTGSLPSRRWRSDSSAAYTMAAAAINHAAVRGISEANTEHAPSTPRLIWTATSVLEGRHSRRQVSDPGDERCEFGILGVLIAHAPAPEAGVFAVRKT